MFEFQNLIVYKKAKQFHQDSKRIIEESKSNKNVRNQLDRASFSIVLNIAEGSGRFSKRDRRNFFVISRSSVFECVAVSDVLKDEKKITEKEFLQYCEKADELSRILYSMIKNLSN